MDTRKNEEPINHLLQPPKKQTKGPNININYICTMEYCFNPQPSHNLKMTEIWADVMSRSPYHLW